MLRKPGSSYEAKRSKTLLKVKRMQTEDYRIVNHIPGKGKYINKLGGYTCKTKTGLEFGVGSGLTDEQRAAPLPIGTVITIHFQEFSNDGVPRFPIFKGVAIDKVT